MLRGFSKKRPLPPQIEFSEKGEYTVVSWYTAKNFIRASIVGMFGYWYFLFTLRRDTILG